VARALEINAADRYANADELREALSAGAAGETFDDPTARTSVLADDETLATRIAATGPPTDQTRRPRRMQPTPGPPTPYPSQAQRHQVEERRPSGARRAVATILLVALLAAAAVGLYFVFAAGGDDVQLRDVTYDNTAESVDALKELVDSNTR